MIKELTEILANHLRTSLQTPCLNGTVKISSGLQTNLTIKDLTRTANAAAVERKSHTKTCKAADNWIIKDLSRTLRKSEILAVGPDASEMFSNHRQWRMIHCSSR